MRVRTAVCFTCALGGGRGRNAARGLVRLRRRRREREKENARGTDRRSTETLTSFTGALGHFGPFHEASQSRSHAGRWAGRRVKASAGPGHTSHGDRGVRLFGSVVHHVLQLAGVGHVVARLVLGQDLHEGTQLEPPLLLGDPVAAHRPGNEPVNKRNELQGRDD